MDIDDEEEVASPTIGPSQLPFGRRVRPRPEIYRQMPVMIESLRAEVKSCERRIEEEKLRCLTATRDAQSSRDVLNTIRSRYEARLQELERKTAHMDKVNSCQFDTYLANLEEAAANLAGNYEPPRPVVSLQDAQTMTDLVEHVEPSEEMPCSSDAIKTCLAPSDLVDMSDYLALQKKLVDLQVQNAELVSKALIAEAKADRFTILEVELKSVKSRLVTLNGINGNLVDENEALKEMLASNMFSATGRMGSRKLVDVVADYETKLVEKNKEVGAMQAKYEALSNTYSNALSMMQAMEEETKKAGDLNKVKDEEDPAQKSSASEVVRNLEKQVADLTARLSKYENPAADEPRERIFHFRENPLDIAHNEFLEFKKSRKRSMNASVECRQDGLEVALSVKERSEMSKRIKDLEFQLHKKGKEMERTSEIQRDLVKKYRCAVTSLTGWQIKMKENEYVELENVLNCGHFFLFKLDDGCKTISIIDNEYASSWTEEIHKYMEQSTPSFLAAVTLALFNRSMGESSRW